MPSSSRRATFARTPRGVPLSTGSNSRVTIDKKFLDYFTDGRFALGVSTIMDRTDASIPILLSAHYTSDYNLVHKNGNVIGDAADVQKILALGSFVNGERKAVLKNSVSAKTKKILAAFVQLQETLGVAGRTFAFSKAFIDIQALECTGANKRIQEHILETVTRSRTAVALFLAHRASLRHGETPRKLNDFLFQENVLLWVFTRLSAQEMQTDVEGFKLRHIYFPKDPTKGLAIAYKEVCSAAMMGNQRGVLDGLGPTRAMFSGPFVRAFCNIPDVWDVVNFGPDSPAKKLAQVPILVPAFTGAVDATETLVVLGKHADGGLMNWQAEYGFQPEDVLRFLGTIPKRASVACISPHFRNVVQLEAMYPGFRYDKSRMEMRGVFAQLAAWAKTKNADLHIFESLSAGTDQCLLRRIVKDCLGVWDDDPLAAAVNNAIPAQDPPDIPFGDLTSPALDRWAEVERSALAMSDQRVDQLLANGRLEASLVSKKRTIRENAYKTARSSLGVNSSALVAQLMGRGYLELGDRIEAWLRTFFSVSLQDAVATTIHAQLENCLAVPVKYDTADMAAYFERF
ncbi:hypothetical protein OCS_04683 [Ophiocordyceps sinensis CO18]|uniref:Uncharacterized protein n=1 Tax=Ophiocordyceps sinensis (strain Co18 / CGMCC 3.14243) TaxID=911162 RepID=T5AB15_OPHSC|nr:hypothetical protein OCS_04683 [Ophiocordyceps sinensis CO18]